MELLIKETCFSLIMDKLYAEKELSSPLHTHNYSEIHIVKEGIGIYTVNDAEYILSSGMAILIPPHTYHNVRSEANTSTFAFQVKNGAKELSVLHLTSEIIQGLFEALENGKSYEKYILYILHSLFDDVSAELSKSTDYGYVIFEFFSQNYNKPISLADIADALNLCPMHAQRVIKKHTGRTFGENLLYHRMTAARKLMEKMPLADIAATVGYGSYSGFWKALKRFEASESANESAFTSKKDSASSIL